MNVLALAHRKTGRRSAVEIERVFATVAREKIPEREERRSSRLGRLTTHDDDFDDAAFVT